MRILNLLNTVILLVYCGHTLAERPEWPSHSEYTASSQGKNGQGSAAETTIQAKPITPTTPVAPATRGINESEAIYVVQLGAFQQRASAQSAALATGLGGVRVMTSMRDGQDWYVLLLGSYKNREDAREASKIYLEANPEASTWIRRAADLR